MFRNQLAECEKALAPFVDWSLTDVLRSAPGAPPLERDDVRQPASLALAICLVQLWRSCGVTPSAVVGHSQGEIAAAWLAGALSLTDAFQVAALRGKAVLRLAGQGRMAALALPEDAAHRLLARWAGRITLSAVNSPTSVVVAGSAEDLAELLAECEHRALRARLLSVDYASHSPHVEQIRDELMAALAPVEPKRLDLPFVSGSTGQWLDPDSARLDAAYWYRNLRDTVRLDVATRTLLADGYRMLIEIGPHPVLAPAVQETIDGFGAPAVVVGSRGPGEGAFDSFVRSLAEVHVRGAAVDWAAFFADAGIGTGTGAQYVDLPLYTFQREHYWLAGEPDRRPAPDDAQAAQAAAAPQEVRQQLTDLGPEERERVMTGLVAAQVAVVLRYPSVEAVPVEETFRDLGFESLTAMELRNRIVATTGVDLQLAEILNYPTVADLAGLLAERWDGAAWAVPEPPPAADREESGHGLADLYVKGVEQGRPGPALALVRAASQLRDSFDRDSAAGAPALRADPDRRRTRRPPAGLRDRARRTDHRSGLHDAGDGPAAATRGVDDASAGFRSARAAAAGLTGAVRGLAPRYRG